MTKSFIIASLLFVSLCLLSAWLVPKCIPTAYIHNDAYIYWIGSQLFWNAQSPYGISEAFQYIKDSNQLQFHWASGYSYPPFLAVVFLPLTFLKPTTAAGLWFVLNLSLYVFFVYRVTRQKNSPWLFLYLFTFSPVLYSLFTGQINIIVLLALYSYVFSPNTWSGALGLAVATIFKVYPLGISLIHVVNKQWRVLTRFIIVLGILCLIPILVMGIATTQEYLLEVLPKLQHNFDGYLVYQSFNSVLQRLTDSDHATLSLLFTSSMVLYLLYFAYHHQHEFPRTVYVWLVGLTLAAGTNTFWNFTPTLLGNLYLLDKWSVLSKRAQTWIIISILLSNVLWHFSYLSLFFHAPTTLMGRVGYTVLTSFGFLYGVIQLILLTQYDRGQKNDLRCIIDTDKLYNQ